MKKHISHIIHYLFFGSVGFATNASIFYFLKNLFHVWYVLSACISFAISVFVSFVLQRTFTFSGEKLHSTTYQAGAFYLLAAVNIIVNGALVYVLVDILKLGHFWAVAGASGTIALYSFFVYKIHIFKPQQHVA